MRYTYFSTKDASVYEEFPNRNTGFDEILEVGKTNDGRYAVRSVIAFETPVSSSFPSSTTFELKLFMANAEKIRTSQKIYVYHASSSWLEGTGYFYQDSFNNEDGINWTSLSASLVTVVSSSAMTGSNLFDLSIDVTHMVRDWMSGSVQNNGLVLQFSGSEESNLDNEGNIKYFSGQTHTIYKPVLVAKWDDQNYTTGSNTWPTSSMNVRPIIKPKYFQNEIATVDVMCSERYPIKTFDNVLTRYDGLKYLPSSSYYSIVDEQAGITLIPFSEESKISSLNNRNYFTFRVQNMYPLRFYRVLIKVIHDGIEEVFDNNSIFQVK